MQAVDQHTEQCGRSIAVKLWMCGLWFGRFEMAGGVSEGPAAGQPSMSAL